MVKPISVKTLNQYLKREFLSDPILKNLCIVGELTNYKSNKYTYFDIKEDMDIINCFSFNDFGLSFKDGDQVIIKGALSLYERGSKYQIKVTSIEKVGLGKELIEFEKLKEKLNKLGYFNELYKKQIPDFPINIGLITSDKSAAIKDFMSIIESNYPIAKLIIYSSRVQGIEAERDIVRGIEKLDSNNLDLIVITRGGGSKEDLSVFNSELIANAIFQAQTPIISAIGHEIDYTISDFVADLRLSTPTKAAEYIIKSFIASKTIIENTKGNIISLVSKKHQDMLGLLESTKYNIELNKPSQLIIKKDNYLTQLNKNNETLLINKINNLYRNLESISESINNEFNKTIDKHSLKLKDLDLNYISEESLQVDKDYYLVSNKRKYKIKVLEINNE